MWQEICDRYTTWRVRRKLTTCGKGLRARNPGLIFLGEGSEVHVGNNVLLERDVRLSTGAGGKIYIGDNSYLGDGCNVLAVKEVTIGRIVPSAGMYCLWIHPPIHWG
jgi:acetyltransferase-like isoleucine patch superfamily enzyme